MKNSIFFNKVVEKPTLTIILSLLLVVLMAVGAGSLYFRGDYKVFFSPENPQLQAFESMQKTFSKNDNVTVILEPKSGDVFNAKILGLVAKITEDAWQTPYSTRVDSLTNYQNTEAEADDLIVDYLVSEFSDVDITDEMVAKTKQVALTEPLLVDRMVSPSGHVTMINITVQLPDKLDQTQEVVEIAEFVRKIVAKYETQYPDVNFYQSGIIMMNNSFVEESKGDMMTLIPAMFLAVLIMLALLLRSVFSTIATLIIIVTSIAATMGISGWLNMYLSTATINVPTIVMTLAIADCVHIIASMNYNLRQGMDKTQAIEQALEINFSPVFITSATTAIGFLTFNFSDVPPLRDLGNLVAVGVMLAFILAITLLPAMLKILPIHIPQKTESEFGRMDKFGDWVIKKHKLLLPVTAFIILASAAIVPLNHINDVPTEYFDKDLKFRQASDFVDENLQGVTMIDFELSSGEPSGINNPKFLQAVNQFTDWLRANPQIDHVVSLSDTFKRLNKNMHGDDPSYYKLPEQQDLAAQYLLMYEMSLPYGLDLNNQINIDKSALRITVNMDNLGSNELVKMEQDAKNWFTENAPFVEVNAASPSLMFAHIGERNMKSMLLGSTLALILISGLLIFALRSFKYGMISLLPNLAPVAMGFGFWAWFSGNINLALSVVTSMCIGIVVDDTVHFLSKYRRARIKGNNAEQAVRYAFSSVGRALWITTLVLCTGFMVLAQSSFALNGDMGLLTAVIIFFALLVDFLFLPAFLLVFDKKDYSKEKIENVETVQTNKLA
ncbi:MMPL family transporter [Catenovulum sp. 2E275]|uniref:efflux RND transporter permease subunit n=1 Tax=Catenovulum sp. 2E275 TaxID=2980497 RepID=UPI0021D0078C|nr:MMPL family transporter [Catenovulum sp. 2E275]MCU4675413.1 MMPL family transporter [Catenovulum sp. 2E275]